jgi:hypothetical protein
MAGEFTIDLFRRIAAGLAAKRELSPVIMTWGIKVYDFLLWAPVCLAFDACLLALPSRQ